MKVRVVSKCLEALDIFRYELASLDGHPLPAFSAGSHIDVHMNSGLVRQYSLCNNPSEDRYVIGVLRDPNSRGGSVEMHQAVNEGDILTISEPRNHFPLDPNAKRSILIAGGIGVTPILCMAERLSNVGADFEMHYCAKSSERMAFREHIARQPYASKVIFHIDDGDLEQKFDADAVLSQPASGTHLYVCGPKGFMDWVVQTAEQVGWAETAIHREYFAGGAINRSSDGSFQIKIASSGEIITVGRDESAVQALERHGVVVPVSCEQGVCGTCITRILSGEPDHRDVFMTDPEHALNDQFTPCCSRAKSPLLVLDI